MNKDEYQPFKYKSLSETTRKMLMNSESGHDWNHTLRVFTNAWIIGQTLDVNRDVIELGAIFHDIADAKFNSGDEKMAVDKAMSLMSRYDIDQGIRKHVVLIIQNISFRNTFNQCDWSSLELKVLQDADRLDAIGAIGIARAFSYGGYKMLPFYNFDIPPNEYDSKESYAISNPPTLNHFYEKLLRLKDGMHTKKGREMARRRHEFLVKYLEQFYAELNYTPPWHIA